MSTILSTDIINNAKEAVGTYEKTAKGLLEELTSALDKLTPTGFEGDASTGYMEFFQKKAVPALDTNLQSLTAGINNILDSIATQLMSTVDVQLGEFNKDPGAGSGGTVA